MTDDELLGRLSARLAERGLMVGYIARLETYGGLLSNAAYNLAQQKRLAPSDRKSLDELRREWDEVIRTMPTCLKER